VQGIDASIGRSGDTKKRNSKTKVGRNTHVDNCAVVYGALSPFTRLDLSMSTNIVYYRALALDGVGLSKPTCVIVNKLVCLMISLFSKTVDTANPQAVCSFRPSGELPQFRGSLEGIEGKSTNQNG
jgi:hypothetical protein